MVKLIQIPCRWCNNDFCVCRCCFRGHAYCCDTCRLKGRLASRRKAQRRYRQTPKGKKNHSLAENRRRHRKFNLSSKNMDDHTSTSLRQWTMVTSGEEKQVHFSIGLKCRCHFCGRTGEIVSHFPRRGYGKDVFYEFVTQTKRTPL